MKNNDGAEKAPKLENAVADVKRQLRLESKSDLIKRVIWLHSQAVRQQLIINKLTKQLNELLKPNTESSDSVNNADVSEGK